MTGSQNDYIRYRLDRSNARTHDGLKTKFFQLYVKTNLIDIEFGKLYSRLIDWRQESDYSVYVDFGEDDVPLIDKVEKFNMILTELIRTKN